MFLSFLHKKKKKSFQFKTYSYFLCSSDIFTIPFQCYFILFSSFFSYFKIFDYLIINIISFIYHSSSFYFNNYFSLSAIVSFPQRSHQNAFSFANYFLLDIDQTPSITRKLNGQWFHVELIPYRHPLRSVFIS